LGGGPRGAPPAPPPAATSPVAEVRMRAPRRGCCSDAVGGRRRVRGAGAASGCCRPTDSADQCRAPHRGQPGSAVHSDDDRATASKAQAKAEGPRRVAHFPHSGSARGTPVRPRARRPAVDALPSLQTYPTHRGSNGHGRCARRRELPIDRGMVRDRLDQYQSDEHRPSGTQRDRTAMESAALSFERVQHVM
jgi:hypothetical protein